MKKDKTRNNPKITPIYSEKEAMDKMAGDVKQHLTSHKEIDTSSVRVQAKDNVVHLSGRVDNSHAKNLAINIAAQEISKVEEVEAGGLETNRDNSEAP